MIALLSLELEGHNFSLFRVTGPKGQIQRGAALFSFWSTVTARVTKLISRNALAHQLSRKPSFELLYSNAEAGNEPLSEALIAPMVL